MGLQFDIDKISRFLVIVVLYVKVCNIISDTLSSSVPLFLRVYYLQITTTFNKPLIFTKISEHYTIPTQYLFLTVYPSTDFATTIKYLIAEFKESINESLEWIIADQDGKVDKKFQNKIHPLSLQVKYISSKQVEQANPLSALAVTYNYFLENMITNNKISTKFCEDNFERKSQSKIYPSNQKN